MPLKAMVTMNMIDESKIEHPTLEDNREETFNIGWLIYRLFENDNVFIHYSEDTVPDTICLDVSTMNKRSSHKYVGFRIWLGYDLAINQWIMTISALDAIDDTFTLIKDYPLQFIEDELSFINAIIASDAPTILSNKIFFNLIKRNPLSVCLLYLSLLTYIPELKWGIFETLNILDGKVTDNVEVSFTTFDVDYRLALTRNDDGTFNGHYRSYRSYRQDESTVGSTTGCVVDNCNIEELYHFISQCQSDWYDEIY